MCGFLGFTGAVEDKNNVLNKMMDRIIHRGPDMGNCYFDEDVALGFRRLSILDLSTAGSQPMQNEDGSIVVVFNGEIYNFMEIRKDLEAKGYKFHCDADTEVLVHGYQEYGDDLIYKLRGMFAFVIWDKNNKRMFGARDMFGIKPFYYYHIPDTQDMIFGSEIKSFLEHPKFIKEVNKDALRPYLTLQYSATEETFFKGVYKLPAAHYFTYENGKMNVKRYWDCDFKDRAGSFQEHVDGLHEVVNESVNAHRIADVKIGSFLSGGVDSSYIVGCQMPDNTFSVGFDYHKFNETNYAKELSDILGIQNIKKLIEADECFDRISDIQYHMDEPQANPSSVPLYFLAELASKEVTVVLSGEGADELFAGYEWYTDTPTIKKYKRLVPTPVRKIIGNAVCNHKNFKGKTALIRGAEMPEKYFVGQAKVFEDEEAMLILNDSCKQGKSALELTQKYYKLVEGQNEITKKQYLDMNMWMPGDILLKADKMCMAHSLELRVPFLDKEVMKYAEGIPTDYRITEKDTKVVLREAANKILPDEWANRPKKGFPVPIKFWLREEKYYEQVKEYFTADYAAEFFDQEAILKILEDHYTQQGNYQRKIWVIFIFLVWYKRFFVIEN